LLGRVQLCSLERSAQQQRVKQSLKPSAWRSKLVVQMKRAMSVLQAMQ
jgi:hypothetical protein